VLVWDAIGLHRLTDLWLMTNSLKIQGFFFGLFVCFLLLLLLFVCLVTITIIIVYLFIIYLFIFKVGYKRSFFFPSFFFSGITKVVHFIFIAYIQN
jgi:hypothetical protein